MGGCWSRKSKHIRNAPTKNSTTGPCSPSESVPCFPDTTTNNNKKKRIFETHPELLPSQKQAEDTTKLSPRPSSKPNKNKKKKYKVEKEKMESDTSFFSVISTSNDNDSGEPSTTIEEQKTGVLLFDEEERPPTTDDGGSVHKRLGPRIKLDPHFKMFKAPCSKSAVRARRSHKKDESAVKPDRKRREAVHETIYEVGGYIMDKTGTRVYVEPNTPYDRNQDKPSIPTDNPTQEVEEEDDNDE